ncbi:hypothetical protein CIW83_05375 [Tissierella sp. P1]|nr:hypothetical protein CIW83_05375 [Tissierella sp. P1]
MIIAFSILSTMIIINNIGAKKDYSWIKKYVPGDICIEGNIDYNSIHDSKSFISRPNLESLERTKNIKSFNAYQIKSLFADIDFNNIDKNSTFYKENKTDIELNKDINGSYTTISTIAFGKKDLKKELEIKDDISPVIISKEFADMIQVKEGDFIYLKMYQEDRNEFTISEHFQVIKIMDEFPVYTKFHSTTEVIVDYDDLQNLYNTIGYDRIDIWLEDNTNLTSINNIKNLEFNSSVSIKTYNDTVKYFQERYIKKILFQIFVIGIFLFIAMANSFTSIFNNIVNRKEEFTLLNIIGISKGEIKRVVLLEGILYGVITSLAVIIIQVIIIIILGMKERSIYVIYTLLFVDLLIISTNILFSNISMNYIVRNQ